MKMKAVKWPLKATNLFLLLLLASLICLLISPRPALGNVIRHARSPGRSSYSNRDGVHLNGRQKAHLGVSETCPVLPYCNCRQRGAGLDVTCERINGYKLRLVCDELKKKEHFIRYFKIRHSDITKLEDHIFMGIKIEHLYIHNSNLRSLGSQSLSTQGAVLSHLVLSKNALNEVPANAISQLRNLDHLNLNENNITVLRAHDFEGLSKVTRLTLYHNQIRTVEANAFSGLTRFMMPYEDNERDLIRLNMGKNYLDHIPKDALLPLKYLQNLDFTENRISTLTPGIFEGMDSLDHLTLNHNQLSHLGQGYFKGLTSLTSLYLDHNNIQTIHMDAFEGLEENLKSLALTGNKISEFPSSALRRIHELETLHMDDNVVERIDEDSFQGFGEHIKYLWLQHNMIKDIPAPAFQDLHSLEWVKLYNNDLKTLHYELMEPVLDTLMHIDIHSNPLVCDCELRWYRQWIEEEWNEIEEEWLKETICTDPVDGQEHNIANVPMKDMFCEGEVSDKPPTNIVDDDGGASSILADVLVLVLAVSAAASNLQMRNFT